MLTLRATEDDIARWEAEGRDDILAYESLGDLWIKEDGTECTRCPFLRRDRGAPTYRCRIHDTKPHTCANYPVSYDQMVQDGCEIVDGLARLGIDARRWRRDRG